MNFLQFLKKYWYIRFAGLKNIHLTAVQQGTKVRGCLQIIWRFFYPIFTSFFPHVTRHTSYKITQTPITGFATKTCLTKRLKTFNCFWFAGKFPT